MSTLTALSISRTLLELSALTFSGSADDVYQFGEIEADGVRWQRVTASSPFAHGRVLRQATKAPSTLAGELYVVSALSAGPQTHDAAVGVLVEALSQFAYTISLTTTLGVNVLTRTYNAEPADITPGESLMMQDAWRWTTLQVDIPIHPVPVAGAW